MASENLQTVIVSKSVAGSREEAVRIARPFANRIYTCKETGSSYRFRQRTPEDFKRSSFRSFEVPGRLGVTLVYGSLKEIDNPSSQQRLFCGSGSQTLAGACREADRLCKVLCLVRKSDSSFDLKAPSMMVMDGQFQDPSIEMCAVEVISSKARDLGITRMKKSYDADLRIVKLLSEGRFSNPSSPKNTSAKKTANKKSKKSKKVSAIKSVKKSHIKLSSPKVMPDPGPCAWLGSLIEWAWVISPGDSCKKVDEKGNAIWEPRSDWMFLWSPKYKAVVSVKKPRSMGHMPSVSRDGGGARMFETFASRPAENTFEIAIPDVPIHKLGDKAAHIVYRSDKWSPSRKTTDYIHQFKEGVKLYCGPSAEKPEVFICFGGKLTLTKRGLVW